VRVQVYQRAPITAMLSFTRRFNGGSPVRQPIENRAIAIDLDGAEIVDAGGCEYVSARIDRAVCDIFQGRAMIISPARARLKWSATLSWFSC
jgi:hypothetical protein